MRKDEDAVLKRFGDVIRKLRKQRGYTQEEFADLIETERAYYGSIERGSHNLTLKKIAKIVSALEIKWSTLFKTFDQH